MYISTGCRKYYCHPNNPEFSRLLLFNRDVFNKTSYISNVRVLSDLAGRQSVPFFFFF